ncbi:MAG: aminotransferase class I/II-fold pyridoxal phosphate-dependent enzyme [Phaeodactylibacter sp.]|nr:aminotransferase class I/II-fold pyridoxal phosphate-dependent enzyme [Phaeodactylibacter sp.]MCB9275899.1 aminotransferase class I/II-fold pyridoxal phosphate-dependent enzyme [Lewinellaceae bacterium]
MKKKIGFGSSCVHGPEEYRTTRPHQLPIYATSSFVFESIEEGMEVFTGQRQGHLYSRFGNPTIDAVAEKIARLESHGMDIDAFGYLTSSGMSAIATLALGLLRPGDAILTQGNLYGGTAELFSKVLEPLNIGLVLARLGDKRAVARVLAEHPSVRMLYFETPANPTLECIDIAGLCELGRQAGCHVVADNTFATPYLQQPLKFGTDFVVHSTTKYLNGHGNSTAGAIIGKSQALMQEAIFPKLKLLGTNCNPWDAWLVNNGLKTLEVRMERHCRNARQVAEWLESRPEVERVNYPGLVSHPSHTLAKRQMRDFGGMLSFELKGGLEAGKQFMNHIKFCSLAPTMGDVDTLILHPASMSHLNVPREIRLDNGITDGLVRLSVGIESVEDIIGDLEQALRIEKS